MLIFKEAMTEFLNHCRYEKYLSAKTLKFYTIALLQFSVFGAAGSSVGDGGDR